MSVPLCDFTDDGGGDRSGGESGERLLAEARWERDEESSRGLRVKQQLIPVGSYAWAEGNLTGEGLAIVAGSSAGDPGCGESECTLVER